jgi:integrase/recombinase XerD
LNRARNVLLSEASSLYLEQRRIEGLSPHTLDSYKYLLSKIQDVVGDKDVADITLQDLRAYLATVTNRKPGTVAMRVRLLRVFCRWLAEEGHARENAARKLKEPKLPRRIPKALNVEELELIRDACQTVREHAIVEFLFSTGCRASELSGVRREDIDWDRQSLIVLGKGNKEREVYLGARASIWVRRYLRSRTDNCEYLFTTERGPARRLTPHQLWYVMKGIAARIGMRSKVWPHVMRHTFATTMVNRGCDIFALQDLMGHEDPKTTEIYAHFSGTSRQEAFRKHFMQ